MQECGPGPVTRILQVSRAVIDGGFDYHAEIAHAYGDLGASVLTVFQRGHMEMERQATFPGRVVCLDARNRRHYKQRSLFSLALWRLSRGNRVDLAICHHLTPARAVDPLMMLGRVRRAYLVVHDYGYFDPNDSEGRKRGRFLRRALSREWAVIGVSSAVCDNVRAHVPELPTARCRSIPNAIDVDGLLRRASDRDFSRQALGIPGKAFVFGTVGRLVPFKAHRELIDAFAAIQDQVPTAMLVIVGRGPLGPALEQQVHALGLTSRVVLRGFVGDAARHMRAFDAFVLPSHNEPFGLVLLEAMACRVPVIASDSGGPTEILPTPEQLFRTGDRRQMSQRMLELYRASETARSRIAEAGHRRALEGFQLQRYRRDYGALLEADDATFR